MKKNAVVLHCACSCRQVKELICAMSSKIIDGKTLIKESIKKDSYEKNFFRGKEHKGRRK